MIANDSNVFGKTDFFRCFHNGFTEDSTIWFTYHDDNREYENPFKFHLDSWKDDEEATNIMRNHIPKNLACQLYFWEECNCLWVLISISSSQAIGICPSTASSLFCRQSAGEKSNRHCSHIQSAKESGSYSRYDTASWLANNATYPCTLCTMVVRMARAPLLWIIENLLHCLGWELPECRWWGKHRNSSCYIFILHRFSVFWQTLLTGCWHFTPNNQQKRVADQIFSTNRLSPRRL